MKELQEREREKLGPFCVYSCATLQAANYGLILIIMDLVFGNMTN